MTATIRYELRPTFRDTKGRFARAKEALLDEKRKQARIEGQNIVALVRGNLRQKTAPYDSGSLERGVRFNTRIAGDRVKMNVTTPERAAPHRIYARRANALAFFWGRVGMQTFVPKRGGFKTHRRGNVLMVGKGYVDHPGGPLGPLMGPILHRSNDEWLRTGGVRFLNRVSTRYVSKLTS